MICLRGLRCKTARVNEHFRKCTWIFVPLYSWAFKNPIVQKICQKKFLNLMRFFSNTVVPVINDRSLLAGFWWSWASKFWPKEPCRLQEVHAQIVGFRQWNIFGLVSISKLLPLNLKKVKHHHESEDEGGIHSLNSPKFIVLVIQGYHIGFFYFKCFVSCKIHVKHSVKWNIPPFWFSNYKKHNWVETCKRFL